MEKTKILLVSPCQGGYGGIEAFVLALSDAIRAQPDFDLRICFKRVRGFTKQPNFTAMIKNYPVFFSDRADADLVDAVRWADLVHLQNASPDVIAITKFFGKRLVLTIHNYMRREWSVRRFLWRVGARFADARWYNSQFVWNTWEGDRKRPGSRKIPTVSTLPEGWTSPEERAGFVFIGRWIANKGIDTLLDAYAAAKIDREKWPLVMMGDGPLRPLIEHAVRTRAINGVQILGFIDQATKTERMKIARWAVVPPNTQEDFGLTAIEARNLGVPCIITRDGGLPEAGGSQALVCEPGDAEGLARLMEKAAAMGEAEYAERAKRTREELAVELEPMDFYPRAYKRILSNEKAD